MSYNKVCVTKRSMPFWCVANPLSDPFGGAVLQKIDSLETAGIIAWAGKEGLIESTAFHDDDLVPWDPEHPQDDLDSQSDVYKKLHAIKAILDEAGLSVNSAVCSLHGYPQFRDGGLCNPDPAIRREAALKIERTIRIGHFFNARYYLYWVARDGFEVPIVTQWEHVYEWLAEGLNHAYDYIKENNFTNYTAATIEPKPNEPRGQMFLPTAGHAVGFMVSMDKLKFLHFGSQIKAQFDDDFPPLVGPEGLKETVMMFYTLRRIGWKGVVEYDCHMLRAEADTKDQINCRKQFIRNCTEALDIALTMADRIHTPENRAAASQADLACIRQMCGL